LPTSKKLSAAGILQVQPLAELTLPYLESLSTGELIELAVKNGLDIPPDLERVFIIEELFYLDHDAEIAHHDIIQVDAKHDAFKEFAVLPKQYHISFIEVIIRDPLWAFVFWEIKAHDRNHYESAPGFRGYSLRVMPLKEGPSSDGAFKEGGLQADEAASFIVSVDIDDYARYLGFPPDNGRCFKVELCMCNHDDYTVLAQSRPFTLPRLIEPASNKLTAVYGNPLALLSGVDRFSLVRSEDRLLRSREIQQPS
jgi:hypothetical protein